MSKIEIVSDFKDFYDVKSTLGGVKYIRQRPVENRIKLLNQLKSIGISTLPIVPVRMIPYAERVVVYDDLFAHDGKGKEVMTLADANMMHGNKMASVFVSDNKIVYKIVQVGKRKFKCIYNMEDLKRLEIVSIEELKSIDGYNFRVAESIFSIDYVCSGGSMLATDFNKVENLKDLGLDEFITADEVIMEVYESLLKYNKY